MLTINQLSINFRLRFNTLVTINYTFITRVANIITTNYNRVATFTSRHSDGYNIPTITCFLFKSKELYLILNHFFGVFLLLSNLNIRVNFFLLV